MSKPVKVFDPPMCCDTGVCGPDVDPKLTQFAADLDWLKDQGVDVSRFNLSQEPQAFVDHATVKAALDESGNDCLPLLVVDDEIVARGFYPTRDQLTSLVGVDASTDASEQSDDQSGCEPSSGCC